MVSLCVLFMAESGVQIVDSKIVIIINQMEMFCGLKWSRVNLENCIVDEKYTTHKMTSPPSGNQVNRGYYDNGDYNNRQWLL